MEEAFLHPAWSFSTNIYEVNIRQYTREGTFAAFQKHLPRLRDMGVEILWFMPVTPISEKNRKGTLGSYYAVQDYTAVNPEFGRETDFAALVSVAHQMGFKIIIDWVANHSGNDNVWMKDHPGFFCYDEATKEVLHPHGWEDVSKLNFDDPALQQAMIEAMRFWITTFDIDGFRCDMAHLVPLQFWEKAKADLQNTKELFWLAECEEPAYHAVFDATYTWKWMHATEEFYKKKINFESLLSVLKQYDIDFPENAFRVYFTANHDENSWNGTEYEKYGDAAKAFAVFSCTWNGIPMIYSGQELPNHKRLKFFDKDNIDWEPNIALHHFYKTLMALRKRNQALLAGDKNTHTQILSSSHDIFCFTRKNGTDEILVILNFSSAQQTIEINNMEGTFIEIFSLTTISFNGPDFIETRGWEYLVFEKEA
ncbi:MAG: 1,4-alpha-glucan branching protein [Chitinophagaceae bacterium]|nr:1,4-alpha-glucan branching protein [Chitinophagaceae bacterium]